MYPRFSPPMASRFAKLVLLLLALCVLPASAVVLAERITTVAGKSALEITEVTREPDGLLKIVHAGGTWRIQQSELTEESQIALGLKPQASALTSVTDLKELQTLDGRKFEGISKCLVSPSEIRIVHSSGVASVRFEELPAEIRKRYGWDATKAVAYERQLEAKAREQEQEALLKRLLAVGPDTGTAGDWIYVDSSPPGTTVRYVKKVTRSEARSLAASSSGPWVWVAGYYRDDGTFVPGHYRTSPDSQLADNWSTEGNHNPVTGKPGSVPSTATGYSPGRVSVRGYYRKNGTYVRPYTRRK